MDQNEKRLYLIRHLIDERPDKEEISIPDSEREQKMLLRGLFNVRLPADISDEFLEVQDEYLKEEISKRGITDIKDLKPVRNGLYIWQGDII